MTMVRNIAKKILLYLLKQVSMNYYDEDEVINITNHLKEFVFPKNNVVLSFPINLDNTINAIYYTIAHNNLSFTIRITYLNNNVYLYFVNTDMTDFYDLTSLFNHINDRFVRCRLEIASHFSILINTQKLV